MLQDAIIVLLQQYKKQALFQNQVNQIYLQY